MNFFFDRCMSCRLARAIQALEEHHTSRAHDDDERFNEHTPDTEWLESLGRDGLDWIVLSADARILRNKVERQALREANLTFFCMGHSWSGMNLDDYAWKFMKVWPKIKECASGCRAPTIFEVSGGSGLRINRRCGTGDPD
jgi:hypothetical protein